MSESGSGQSGSNANGANVAGHRRRVSTQGMQLSYAYGAPSQPNSNQRLPVNPSAGPSRRAQIPSPSIPESGAERYARLKEAQSAGTLSQPRPIPKNYSPVPGSNPYTSVNVATAFYNAAATTKNSSHLSAANLSEEEEEEVEHVASESTARQEASDSHQRASKKRKKSSDPAYRQSATPSDDESEPENIKSSRRQAKKRRSSLPNGQLGENATDEVAETQPANGNVTKSRRKRQQDSSYRPSRDGESSSDSDDSAQSGNLKGKSKPKPRRVIAPRPSTPGPKVIGAFPSPEPDSSADISKVTYTLTLPHPNSPESNASHLNVLSNHARSDTPSSTSYEQESAMVREKELEDLLALQRESKQRSEQVARAVLAHPSPHQRSSAQAAAAANGVSYKVPAVPRARRDIPAVPSNQPSRRKEGMVAPPNDGYGDFAKDDLSFGSEGGRSGYSGGVELANRIRELLEGALEMLSKGASASWQPVRYLVYILKSTFGEIRTWPWNDLLRWAVAAIVVAVIVGSIFEDRTNSRWIPRRSAKTQAEYFQPNAPPSDFNDFAKRLTEIEKAASRLFSAQSEARRDAIENYKSQSRALEAMESNLAAYRKDQKQALSLSENLLSSRLSNLESSKEAASKTLQTDLDSVKQRLKDAETRQDTTLALYKQLALQVDSVQSAEKGMQSTLTHLKKQLEGKVTAEQAKQLALDAIEKVLPSQLAVRLDRKGKVVVDPSFWAHLKAAFAPIHAATDKNLKSGKAVPLNWNDFLEANEAALSRFVGDAMHKQAADGAILSRKTFMDLLQREMNKLTADFERQANENVQSIGQEMLRKVDKQIADVKAALPSTSESGTRNVELPDGRNVTDIIAFLVDAALLKHSKDILARPDYALFTGGARVIPALTSPSLEISPPGVWRKSMAWLTGSGTVRGRPPVTALHPDLSVGSCWAFPGPTAQLGVRLSRKIIVDEVVIEHASKDVAYDVSSAPTDFEVWGIVDNTADAKLLAERRKTIGNSSDDYISTVPPSDRHFLLASGTYDVQSASHIQAFSVLASAGQLEIPVGTVLLRILGTRGGSSGCLYRFRVGGREL